MEENKDGQLAGSSWYFGIGLSIPLMVRDSDIPHKGPGPSWGKCVLKRNCNEPEPARDPGLCKWNTLFGRTGKLLQKIWFALCGSGVLGLCQRPFPSFKLLSAPPCNPEAAGSLHLASRVTFSLEAKAEVRRAPLWRSAHPDL